MQSSLLAASVKGSANAPAAIAGPRVLLWVSRDAGLFEKNGLRADVAYVRSG
jgi:hypothetical protein